MAHKGGTEPRQSGGRDGDMVDPRRRGGTVKRRAVGAEGVHQRQIMRDHFGSQGGGVRFGEATLAWAEDVKQRGNAPVVIETHRNDRRAARGELGEDRLQPVAYQDGGGARARGAGRVRSNIKVDHAKRNNGRLHPDSTNADAQRGEGGGQVAGEGSAERREKLHT